MICLSESPQFLLLFFRVILQSMDGCLLATVSADDLTNDWEFRVADMRLGIIFLVLSVLSVTRAIQSICFLLLCVFVGVEKFVFCF